MMEKIVLGGGCFWCLEAVFIRLQGVHKVRSGYAGGFQNNPDYRQVCSGKTGHAEVIEIQYDPDTISLTTILEVFFAYHDPTTLNRQGHDVGTQYRSIILYANENQQKTAKSVMMQLKEEATFGAPIVTEVKSLEVFWPAELEHDGYYDRNPMQPYCMAVIGPKISKLRAKHSHLLKDEA